jgi:hypothetical protein
MITSRTLRAAIVAAVMGFGAISAQAQQTIQTWLMLKDSSQETFFVTDRVEQSRLLKTGWKVSGTAFLLAKPNADSVGMIRFAKGSESGSDRIFAISPEQVAEAVKAGYAKEGLMGQASATQTVPEMVPVYHFTKDSRNLWLIEKADQAWAEKSGWKAKGVAFWLWSKASS